MTEPHALVNRFTPTEPGSRFTLLWPVHFRSLSMFRHLAPAFLFAAGALTVNVFAQSAAPASAPSSGNRLVLTGDGETIVLEPYAQNVIRVSISKSAQAAEAKPGYGV